MSKKQIKPVLQNFAQGNLTENALNFFNILGYNTERQAPLETPTYSAFKESFSDAQSKFNEDKALAKDWKYVDLLFQLSREELHGQTGLFDKNRVDNTVMESYLFFAIELRKPHYTRTELSHITREVNRLFPMPVMLLFKNGETLTLSIINRRLSKRDESRDVLEKVTLIKDIRIDNPHRAHIDILFDLSLGELKRRHGFTNFVELHNAWRKTLDTKELNKRFFQELASWYFWAQGHVQFPNDKKVEEKRNRQINLIRLITRLIFVWFLKEKNLVGGNLFEKTRLKKILKVFEPNSEKTGNYYPAILQNLFFGTLNQKMNERGFVIEGSFHENKEQYGVKTRYRYASRFNIPAEDIVKLFQDIPFLNGGLFDCLDKENEDTSRVEYVDGFSRNPKKVPLVPDCLFFGKERMEDLTEFYGIKKNNDKVRGLIEIFEDYKFTIEENTPIEEEIALDPELLGKVFENLLAYYNPETETTARKQTGSFYTPREIVNYMVDESLKAYLKQKLESTPSFQLEGNSPPSFQLEGNSTPSFQLEDNIFLNPYQDIKIAERNLPHWQQPNVAYFVTFHLADSIPREKAEQIKKEREQWLNNHKEPYSSDDLREYYRLFSQKTEDLLNAGHGSCALSNPENSTIVANALLYFDKERYILDEWVVMPNHVHVIVKPLGGNKLSDILHSWKSYTANEINKRMGKTGQFWMHESYDHIIRNEKSLLRIREYIRNNPEKSKTKLPHSSSESIVPQASSLKGLNDKEERKQDACSTLENRLSYLISYSDTSNPFNETETEVLINAIDDCKILDPACGSGAFPMGALHKLVHLLGKLDPDNSRWRELQKRKAIRETDEAFNIGDVKTREDKLKEINETFEHNTGDYGRKLYLIENCIYGVDIQAIAVQISKLRFFISLVVDQKERAGAKNRGIRPLPNLETKFVAANTLIGLEQPKQLVLMPGEIETLKKELRRGRDIKKWKTEWAGLYVIFTRRGVDIEKYTAIKSHLEKFRVDLEPKKSDKDEHGRKPGSYKWYEIQDNIAYYEEFERPKIIYPDISQHSKFTWDESLSFLGNTAYIIPTEEKWLVGLLNSELIWWFYLNLSSIIRGGFVRFIAQYMEQLPIFPATPVQKAPIIERVHSILSDPNSPDVPRLEAEIDRMVYSLYGLTEEEIAIVEGRREQNGNL